MKETINFGAFIRNRRQKLGLDIRELSKISDTDQGGISRIENGHTSTLVDTAIRICTALDITAEELYHVYNKKSGPLLRIRNPSKKKDMLNVMDTRYFVGRMLQDPKYAWNELIKITLPLLGGDTNKAFPLSINTDNIFLGSDNKLELNTSIIDNMVIYPDNIDNKLIIEILKNDGVITIKDIGAFIRNIRHQKSMSLTELQDKCHISDSTLCKLENATMRNIKLHEVLMLDHALESGGVLFDLCWKTLEYESFIGGIKIRKMTNLRRLTKDQLNIAYIPIYIYRWLQIENNLSDIKWLRDFRRLVKADIKVDKINSEVEGKKT